MDYREFAAQQGEEGTTRRNHRPANSSLFTVAQEDVAYPLPHLDDPRMLGDPSTSMDLQYIPQPTSSVPFQSNQLLAEPAGPVQAQETQLPKGILLQLAEAEWQYAAARYQILEKAQAFPTNSHVREATAGYPYTSTGEAATGFTGAYDSSSVPAYPPQIPNPGFIPSDGSSTYGFDVHSWSGQQLTPTVIYPNTPHDHIQGFGPQGNTFSDAQDLHYNAVGDAGYGQRPPINPMALTTSHYNTGPSLLSTCNLGSNTSSLMMLTRYHHPQPGLPLQAVGPVPVPANQLPTYMANDIEHDTMGPLAASPLWDEVLTLSAARSFATTMHELPPVAETSFDATETLDMTGATGLLVPCRAIRRKPKYGKRTQSIAASPYHRKTGPGREMENVSFYTDPEAYSQQQKDQPKVYSQRTDKSKSSCFGCRRSKRKCTILTGDACQECRKILGKHYDRTVLPKFTCNVRTKFSEMSIFTDISPTGMSAAEALLRIRSSLSQTLKIDWDDDFPPVTIEDSASTDLGVVTHVVVRLMSRIRSFLDILEPSHIRQFIPPTSHEGIFMSYSFSMVRWKKAICFFWPDLKDVLDFHDTFHRYSHHIFFRRLDRLLSSGKYEAAALLLNFLYEGISSMEDPIMIELPAKEHLLSSITHHILHVYRVIATRMPATARYVYSFPETSELFPESCGVLPNELWVGTTTRDLLHLHKDSSNTSSRLRTTGSVSKKVLRGWKRPPVLDAYLPANFLALFGISTESVDATHAEFNEMMKHRGTILPNVALDLSPLTLSISLKAFFDQANIAESPTIPADEICGYVVLVSVHIWEFLRDCHLRAFMIGPSDPENCELDMRYIWECGMMGALASGDKSDVHEFARGAITRCAESAALEVENTYMEKTKDDKYAKGR